MKDDNKTMIYKLLRQLAKPIEDATIDVATDITTKTAKQTAEKSAEASVDAFFSGLDYAAKRTREKSETLGAFALYCLKGGLVTEFKISAQRMNKNSNTIKGQRKKKLKPPARKK